MLPDNYSLTIVNGPATEPVTTAFAKLSCRIQSTSEDDLIAAWIKAAREQVENDTDLKLMPQTWLYKFDGIPVVGGQLACMSPYGHGSLLAESFDLPLTPVISISSVKYLDTNHAQQTLDPSLYYLESGSIPPRLLPAPGHVWPATSDKAGAWEIEILAGFEDETAVPFRAKQAICLLVGHWNQNRELATDRNTKAVEHSYDMLVAGLRRGFV